MNETNASYDNCIAACDACARACDTCAAGCLAESDTNPLARCIALDIECAQLCRVASGAMARRSTLAPQVCVVRAGVRCVRGRMRPPCARALPALRAGLRSLRGDVPGDGGVRVQRFA
jgi:hypothetical protein